jgi:beta-lactamase class A
LTAAEDVLLSKLTKSLCDEWAASTGLSATHALREIEGYLNKGRLVYAPESAKTQSNRLRGGDW